MKTSAVTNPDRKGPKNAGTTRTYLAGEVRSVQAVLKMLGYYGGLEDDDYGHLTTEAVRDYQAAQLYFPGLKADGDWGPATERHYEWTKRLQVALNRRPAVVKAGVLKVDGDFRAITRARVKADQAADLAAKGPYWKMGGRTADGIPGPLHCKALGIARHPGLD